MFFEAKVDLWFLLVFYGAGAAMLITAPRARHGHRLGVFMTGFLAVLGVVFMGIAWRADSVSFEITQDGHLDSLGWPFDGRIAHVSEIRSIVPSSDSRSSHAASLDRLRVDYGEHGLIFIAVEDEPGFLDALAAKDPSLIRTADGLRR